jgi:hypothetical protein
MSLGAEARISELWRERRDGHKHSTKEIADQLTEEGVPTAHGGTWCEGTVYQALERLGLIGVKPKVSPEALYEIRKFTKRGEMPSYVELTAHLNAKKLKSPRGGRWHSTSTYYLIKRLRRAGMLLEARSQVEKYPHACGGECQEIGLIKSN